MKLTTIFSMCLVACAHAATAQCDIHYKRDEFTGKASQETGRVRIIKNGDSPILKTFSPAASDNCFYKDYLQFIVSAGKIEIAISEESDNCVCSAQRIEFKLADKTVISKSDAREGKYVQHEGTGTQTTYFQISREELAAFAASPIDKVRITNGACTDHQVVKEEIADKAAAAIQELAKCLLRPAR